LNSSICISRSEAEKPSYQGKPSLEIPIASPGLDQQIKRKSCLTGALSTVMELLLQRTAKMDTVRLPVFHPPEGLSPTDSQRTTKRRRTQKRYFVPIQHFRKTADQKPAARVAGGKPDDTSDNTGCQYRRPLGEFHAKPAEWSRFFQ
jgi:hypothetical protein